MGRKIHYYKYLSSEKYTGLIQQAHEYDILLDLRKKRLMGRMANPERKITEGECTILATFMRNPTQRFDPRQLWEAARIDDSLRSSNLAVPGRVRTAIYRLRKCFRDDFRGYVILPSPYGINEEIRGVLIESETTGDSLAQYYFLAQRNLIKEMGERFIGRHDILRAVDTFLNEERAGVVFITGVPGQGKTALACKLARRYDAIHHFAKAEEGRDIPVKIMQSIHAQLIDKYALNSSVPEGEDDLKRDIGNILWTVSPQRVVVVLDALNEILPIENQISLGFLPLPPPDGVFYILTSQPTDAVANFLARVGRDTCCMERDLHPLDREEIRMMAQYMKIEIREEDFEEICSISEGNALYVKTLFEEMKRTTCEWHEIPSTIQNLYAYLLRKLLYDDEQGRTISDILGILVIAREELTIEQLVDMLGSTPRYEVIKAVAKIRHLLSPGDKYFLYHNSLIQFLKDPSHELGFGKKQLANYAERIIAYCEPWQKKQLPYAYRYLCHHYFETGDTDSIMEVIRQADAKMLNGIANFFLYQFQRIELGEVQSSPFGGLLDRVLSIEETTHNRLIEAITSRLFHSSLYPQAEWLLQKVLPLWEQREHPVIHLQQLYADVLDILMKWDVGIDYFEKSYQKLPDNQPKERAILLTKLGLFNRRGGKNYQLAQEKLESAYSILKNVDDVVLQRENLAHLLRVYTAQDKRDAAIALLKKHQGIFDSLTEDHASNNFVHQVVFILMTMGDFEQAYTLAGKGLMLARSLEVFHHKGRHLAFLGYLEYFYRGEKQRGKDMVEEAVQLLRASGNFRVLGMALRQLGSIYRDCGDLEKARQLTNEAHDIYRDMNDVLGVAHTLYYKANIERSAGNVRLSTKYREEGERLFRSAGHTIDLRFPDDLETNV